MNSYISSFKAPFAALAIIVLVELGYSAVAPSSAVERSSYLNWNFNSTELFHKVLIHEKLANAVGSHPGVIQIGDSSGLHGIVPGIVDQYLGGLRYENLSCCANTGFDGYHTIADFMLRHAPSIKAVVLYMSLNNPPRDLANALTAVVGGEDRLRNAFGPLAPFISPPTLAARPAIVRSVYTQDHTFNQPGLLPFGDLWPELIQSLRATRGWRPEGDVHRVPEKQRDKLKELCGASGVLVINGHDPQDYTRDVFGIRRASLEIELRRLADLTARHHAKLILLIQPYPCPVMEGSFVAALKADVAAVMADYPNLVVPDPALFEAWPGDWFSSPDHLRIGYEDAASRRAGRAIAKALDVPFAEPPKPPAPKPPVSISSTSDFKSEVWKAEGLLLTPHPNGGGVVAVETREAGLHRLEATLPALAAKTYVASMTFSTDGPRHVFFQFHPVQWPGDFGHFHCSASALEVSRSSSVLDSAIEELPNHRLRCWGKFKLTKPGAVMGIGLSPTLAVGPYRGDGTSSVVFYDFELSAVDNPED